MATADARFNWSDPLLLDAQLTDDERMVRDAARAYCQEQLAPRVLEAFRKEHTDPAIFREMGALDLLGVVIPEQYGGSGYGLEELAVVAEQLGRAVQPTTLHSTTAQSGPGVMRSMPPSLPPAGKRWRPENSGRSSSCTNC